MKLLSSSRRGGILLSLLFILLGLPPSDGHAQAWDQDSTLRPVDAFRTAEQLVTRRKVLEEDKAAIERLRQQVRALSAELLQRIAELEVGQLTEVMLEQARLDVESARLRLDDLQVELANAERRIRELEQLIRDLEAREQLLRNPAKGDELEPERRVEQLERTTQLLAQQRTELELEKLHRENLFSRIELVNARLSLLNQWLARVEEVYRLQQEQIRREAQEDLEKHLQKEQQAYLERAVELSQKLQRDREQLSEARRRLLETGIRSAEEQATLFQLDIRLSRIDNDLARLEGLANKIDASLKELQEGLGQLQGSKGELDDTATLLQRKINLFEQQQQVIERREGLVGADARAAAEEAKIIDELLKGLSRRQERIQSQLADADAIYERLDANYRESLSKNLLDRRQLPGSADEWRQLLEGIFAAPKAMLYQVRLSVETALNAIADTTALRWMGLIFMELGLFWLVAWARRSVTQAIYRAAAREDTSFFGNLSLNLLLLLRKNLIGAAIALAVLIAVWMAQVPQPGSGIILTLVLMWGVIRIPIDLARMLLTSPRLSAEQRRPQLYQQLRWTLFVGGLLGATSLLAHLSSLPEEVSDAFDRLFMLYLLVIFIPVLRLRHFLYERLAERYGSHNWFIILHLITLVLPLCLLGTALLGLVGYLNLAWTAAWHLLAFIVVLVGWLLVRGLLDDLMVWLKNFAITHSDYALLWTQDVISPLHKIMRVVLFVGAWVVLFQVYGWGREAAIVNSLWHILDRPLFTLGGAQVTLWGIISTVLILLIIIWLGQWLRAVTYRWVYSRIVDLGARHSLSVFTQYAIVLIGMLIILQIIGLDLTTLTVFAGAVGVGIGFGMQTIANNFISGLLLLVERPLRSGDIVKIGSNEGEVARIGMRSLTMKTFDNMEVFIPNSDVITNAFTNWTHSDKIVRTVLMVRIAYDADPHKVQSILEKVVFTHAAVVREPEPLILLWEFTDSCMHFRVQYFMDVVKHNFLKIRSEVHFSIWDALKRSGIRIPYPQQDLYIKEWPEEVLMEWRRQELAARQEFEQDQGVPRSTNTPLVGI